jgi:thioredoxin-related protein
MRRVVTVLMIVMVASVLAACGGTPAATSSNTPAVVPATQPAANTAQTGAAGTSGGSPSGDIYSPTQTVDVGDTLSTDAAVVPASVLANVAAKKPMLIFWSDPTTKVTTDQVKEITAALKKYTGMIQLVNIDYTVGLGSTGASSTIDPETQKIELFASSLKINTTPYIVFVDQYGRITYKFAGIVDKGLLTREVLRATTAAQ